MSGNFLRRLEQTRRLISEDRFDRISFTVCQKLSLIDSLHVHHAVHDVCKVDREVILAFPAGSIAEADCRFPTFVFAGACIRLGSVAPDYQWEVQYDRKDAGMETCVAVRESF